MGGGPSASATGVGGDKAEVEAAVERGGGASARDKGRGKTNDMAELEVSSKEKMEHSVSRTDEGLGG